MTRAIVDVSAIECALVDATWTFATSRADEIDDHWQRRRADNPHLYNGSVLLLHHGDIVSERGSAIFRGACFQTDFKNLMAWREFGFPKSEVRNIFSMAAVESRDGAFLLGEMAPHTAPAGQIYFPSGTPDLADVKAGRVDIEGSAARELAEETGLDPEAVTLLPGLTLLIDPVRVCCMKPVRVDEPGERLARRIDDWLALDPHAELARMHVVRSMADVRPAMPDFVVSYLAHRLAQR